MSTTVRAEKGLDLAVIGNSRFGAQSLIKDCFDGFFLLVENQIRKPLEQWTVKREFLELLEERFAAERIEIPYPRQTLALQRRRHASESPAVPAETPTQIKG